MYIIFWAKNKKLQVIHHPHVINEEDRMLYINDYDAKHPSCQPYLKTLMVADAIFWWWLLNFLHFLLILEILLMDVHSIVQSDGILHDLDNMIPLEWHHRMRGVTRARNALIDPFVDLLLSYTTNQLIEVQVSQSVIYSPSMQGNIQGWCCGFSMAGSHCSIMPPLFQLERWGLEERAADCHAPWAADGSENSRSSCFFCWGRPK